MTKWEKWAWKHFEMDQHVTRAFAWGFVSGILLSGGVTFLIYLFR